jgi:Pyruvate/2-oxoacid:ferredoxin oxidoreductase delta subunit/flavodoxin
MDTQIPSVGLMYFSPTGTTRKVCEEIAKAISTAAPTRMDLTKPQNAEPQNLDRVDLWVIGIPVYASRMPLEAYKRITHALDSLPKKIPAIAVSVYGNVDSGVALKQLVELLTQRGLNVVGAGEFIGQHWFKKFHGLDPAGTLGRPNEEDLAVARQLGVSVLKKGLDSSSMGSMDEIESAKVPFKLRFTGEERVLGLLGPSTVDLSKCTKCQACVKACPMSCIDPQTLTSDTSKGKCLGCGNCVKVCPNNARSQGIRMKWLVKRMAKPKNPADSSICYV